MRQKAQFCAMSKWGLHDEHDVPLYETQLEIAGTHVVPERVYPEVQVLLAKANKATRTRSLLIFAIMDLN